MTRVINFYACQSRHVLSINTVLQAQIVFDDYPVTGLPHCTPGGSVSTCGSSMTVNSWIVETANH